MSLLFCCVRMCVFRSGCVIMTTIKATSFEYGAIAFVPKQGGGASQNGKKWHVKGNRGGLCRVRFPLFFFLTPLCIFTGERRLPNTARFLPVPRAGTVFLHAVHSFFFPWRGCGGCALPFFPSRAGERGGLPASSLGLRGRGPTPRSCPKRQGGEGGGSEKGGKGAFGKGGGERGQVSQIPLLFCSRVCFRERSWILPCFRRF